MTDIVQQLAAYPHPLVRAFVFGSPSTRYSDYAPTGRSSEEGAAADGGAQSASPAPVTATTSLRGAPTCLLATVSRIQAELMRHEAEFPALAADLAAYRSDADGYLKKTEGSGSSSSKKRAKAKNKAALTAPGHGRGQRSRAQTMTSPSSGSAAGPSVAFRRRGTNTSTLSSDADVSLNVSGWDSHSHDARDDASASGSLPGAGALAGGPVVDSGAPSVVAQSEHSERSVHSGASSGAHRSPSGDALNAMSDGGSPALTQRALAEHEARVAGDGDHGEDSSADEASQADTASQAGDDVRANAARKKEGRKFALKVLIFEEFLKELAALGLEHALLSVEPPTPEEEVGEEQEDEVDDGDAAGVC